MTRFTQVVVRFRVVILLVAAGFVLLGGVAGRDVATHLRGGTSVPAIGESAEALEQAAAQFGIQPPNLVVLVTADGGQVGDPDVTAAGVALTRRIAAEDAVADVYSYWTANAPSLASRDGDQALVIARVTGEQDTAIERALALEEDLEGASGPLQVQVGGPLIVSHELTQTIDGDLRTAERVVVPLTLLALVVVFGSVVAAGIPVLVGILAVLVAYVSLKVLAQVTDIHIFALNLTTALGFGLAIDYSLFLVRRFREELPRQPSTAAALVRTMQTGGKTIAVSAATLIGSLTALLLFPHMFLRSFGLAGITVVTGAVLGALLVIPALLSLLGPRVNRLSLRRTPEHAAAPDWWYRFSHRVMRRPGLVAVVITALLAVLLLPFLQLVPGAADDRALPAGNSARALNDTLREDFSSQEAQPIAIVAPGAGDPASARSEIDDFARRVSLVPDVARVDALTGSYAAGEVVAAPTALSERFAAEEGTWFSAALDVEPLGSRAEQVVERIRSVDPPFPVLVGGDSASVVDAKAAIADRMVLAIVLVVLVNLVVLTCTFRSVLIPVKAVVLNTLSLTAVFGLMVWLFQEGNLSGLLGFTATGVLEATTPILMFCVAFGLSIDYEVFVISRIKEEHEAGWETREAVARGLQGSAGVITTAAVLMAIVFVAVATSSVSIIKMFGIGLAVAVLVDAMVIRSTLLPALMVLMGRANWWPGGRGARAERASEARRVAVEAPCPAGAPVG
ncbi:MMPL family transporter [Geodermatophilus sabuli]|uniref:Putative drug exporter of the RND superfamily n=1 Tax=Geodermatophilus sabuli TaxID=1564158 RepID=A0A285EE61_9ACTN|nr:MMPL family transporter [Geodermatophilus sabuli]MBB3084366.1 RND superfamily putative drug exporter [Geodermatophilus sabuli]SNX96366.1 putative drug exporter of the RND superfamily [Geodermatophilus sabuli]